MTNPPLDEVHALLERPFGSGRRFVGIHVHANLIRLLLGVVPDGTAVSPHQSLRFGVAIDDDGIFLDE